MIFHKSLRRLLLLSLLPLFPILYPGSAAGDTVIWDANTGTSGPQDGAPGNWTLGGVTFWNTTTLTDVATVNNTTADIAQFGANSGIVGGNINVSTQSINGLIFDTTGTATGYTLTASAVSTLTIGTGGITMTANAQSSTVGSFSGGTTSLLGITTVGNQSWINNSTTGTLTIAGLLTPAAGTTITMGGAGNINIQATTPGGNTAAITKVGSGTLTWSSDINTTGALNINDSGTLIFNMSPSNAASDMLVINVNDTSTFHVTSTSAGLNGSTVVTVAAGATYQNDLNNETVGALVGTGKVTTANTASGTTNLNLSLTTDKTFDGTIADNGVALFAITKQNSNTVTLTGTNTYTGGTTIQRGTLALDFSATAGVGSTDNILAAAGKLTMTTGGGNGSGRLSLIGAAGETNTQTFSSTAISAGTNTIQLTSGAGGSMNVDLKAITISTGGFVTFIAPVSGAIKTSNAVGNMSANVLYVDPSGVTSFAKVVTNAGSNFIQANTGDFVYETGKTISTVTNYSSTGIMRLDNTSTGNTTQASGVTALGSVSYTDTNARTMDVGTGNTLRFAVNGGVLVDPVAGNLTIGTAVGAAGGTVTAGTAAGELSVDVMNASATVTINSVIAANGGGSTAVTKNGSGALILAAANTYAGATTINAGRVEIRNNTALGTTGSGTTVVTGAELDLSGNINIGAEALSLTGTGVSTAGALQNLSGNNTWGGTITLGGTTTISAAVGSTLTLDVASGNAISAGTNSFTIAAAGDVVINDPIAISSGSSTLTKTGAGTLFLNAGGAAWASTGTFTISAGVVRISNGAALGGTTGATTVSSGAALEITGGISSDETLNINGTGINNAGAIRSISGANTLTGVISLNGNARINADAGATLTLTNTATAAIQPDSGGNRQINLGGDGTINVSGIMRNNPTNSRVLTVVKDGNGTVNLTNTNTYTGATTVSSGTLALGAGGNLGDTKITVSAGATLLVSPGANGATNTIANATAANTLTLGGGATLSMLDNATSTLAVSSTASFVSGSTVSLNLGGAATDTDHINMGGAITSGGMLNFVVSSGTTSLTTGDYTFMTGASGLGASAFTLAANNVTVNGTTYGLFLTNSTTGAEVLTISNTVNSSAAAVAYWTGNINGSWTAQNGGTLTTNFSSDAAGTTDTYALPSVNTNVYLTANSATNLSTTLDANTSINSLTFTGTGTANTAGFTIASGGAGTNTLTLNAAAVNGSAAGTGITVLSGSGTNTISANVIVPVTQTWTAAAGATLNVSGNIATAGTAAITLTLAGAGDINLSGAITKGAAASINIASTSTGTVSLTGTSTITTLTVGTGGILDIGASTLTLSNSGGTGIRSSGASGTATINATGGGSINLSTTGGTNNWLDNGAANGTTLIINAKLTGVGYENYVGNNGTGIVILTNTANSFASMVINNGVLTTSVMGNSGSASPLGTSGTIIMSQANTSASGVLRYIGTGETTNKNISLSGSTANGIVSLDASNTAGLLKMTGTITGGTAALQTVRLIGTGNAEVAGVISNTNSTQLIAIDKQGAGTWALSGANTYTGATTVNGGALQVGVGGLGSTASGSAVSVSNATGVLAGTGTINGTLAVTLGTVKPGDNAGLGAGTLTINNNVTVANAAGLNLDISAASGNDASGLSTAITNGTVSTWASGHATDAPGAGNDLLKINGSLTLGGTGSSGSVVVVNALAPSYLGSAAVGDYFNLLDWTGALNGAFSVGSTTQGAGGVFGDLTLPTLTDGNLWDVSQFTSTGLVFVVAAPEPGRVLLLALGLVGLGLRRRRR